MADYAANPANAKNDQQIIDLRKRMLAVFLNRCRRMEQVRTDGVWWRFLDPNASWVRHQDRLPRHDGFTDDKVERGLALTPYRVHPQVYNEGTTARYGQRVPGAFISPSPGCFSEAENGWRVEPTDLEQRLYPGKQRTLVREVPAGFESSERARPRPLLRVI